MIDPLAIWQAQWDLLPPDPTGVAFPFTIAGFITARVTGKLEVGGIYLPSAPTVFTFNAATFAAGITGLAPVPIPGPAAAAFSTAFSSACSSSVFVVAPGGSVGAPTPPTTFSAPPVAIFLPASVVASTAALLASLLTAVPTGLPLTSQYPIALYTAFATLQVSLTGINSVPIPQPLVYVGPVL